MDARGIGKSFGAVRALDGVDLTLRRGEVHALVGENGSGKSTLSKILAGALAPDEGEIITGGERRHFRSPSEALASGIALVPQEPMACPDLSIAENVLLHMLTNAFSRFQRKRMAREARVLLERVGVDCDPLAPLATLSAGDRVLVEVAKALVGDPQLIILDESTSRLGPIDAERLFEIVGALRDEGKAAILITHRLAEITAMADRATVLRDGRFVGELSRDELSESRLAAMMVGRELEDYFHKREITPGRPVLDVKDLLVEGSDAPVSFTVRAGEVVGIAGLVGAGRTELMETIAGHRRARGGTVAVDGEPVELRSPMSALRAGVALVPEDRHAQGLSLGATLRENVAMGSWPLWSASRRKEARMADGVIKDLRVKAAGVDVPMTSLSGGNQQKVVLGRSILREPRVLLLDEPTRGIDVGAKEDVFQIIGRMLERGTGVVMVSSELMELLGVCDRILVMHDRRVVGELVAEHATEESLALLCVGGTLESAA